jgi:hypothetical protein
VKQGYLILVGESDLTKTIGRFYFIVCLLLNITLSATVVLFFERPLLQVMLVAMNMIVKAGVVSLNPFKTRMLYLVNLFNSITLGALITAVVIVVAN